MDAFLQLWGGLFYLLNKIFLSQAEGKNKETQRKGRIAGWAMYLIGLPAWTIILIEQRNWMITAIEVGGAPAMFLGLAIALQGRENINPFFERLVGLSVYFLLVVGVSYSLYDYGGITAISQVFEIGTITGFLMGTYMLARERRSGWAWFALMNIATGMLMLHEGKEYLALQQALSLCFVVLGFNRSKNQKGE